MNDKMILKGILTIDRYNNGIFDKQFKFENLITDLGFTYIAKAIGGDIIGINKLGLGDNNTHESPSDTKLYNRLVLLNVNRDYSIPKTLRFLATVPENTFSETVYYREAGLIYQSTTEEILITRVTFPENEVVFQKPSNSFSISYELKFL